MAKQKRIYLDLSDKVADILIRSAFDARIPMKRYVELLIERDAQKRTARKK